MHKHPVAGSLLGTAVGDALGLPYEGLSRRRAERLLGRPEHYRLVLRRGMVSDDTEHSVMVAQALLACGGSVEKFQRGLAWRLRWWLLGLPAGIGLATARAIVRLWLGFGLRRCGVYSAGNGPAMRAAILGAVFNDVPTLREFVRASTRLTHTDPKAEYGALTVALAARMARQKSDPAANEFIESLNAVLGNDCSELMARLEQAAASVVRGESTLAFASQVGLSEGVTGYVLDTVPVAIHAWLSFPHDLKSALIAVIECGGDSDTTAAITGGIAGAGVGREGIPLELLEGLRDWPLSRQHLERLGNALDLYPQTSRSPVGFYPIFPLLWPRNLLFLGIVLVHGLRRLLPPY